MNEERLLHIHDFPDSVLLRILSHVDQVELHLSVSWACRRWNNLCYDRYLWEDFSLVQYEQSINGDNDFQIGEELVDTRGFQRYILQCIHSYVKHLTLSHLGTIFIPVLDAMGLRSLERLGLPYQYYTDYTEENLRTIQNIQNSTSADIYAWSRRTGYFHKHDWPLCYKMSKIVTCGDSAGTKVHTVTEDWSLIAAFLQENCSAQFVRLHCDISCRSKIVPPEIFKQLSRMKKLLYLEISGCSLRNLSVLLDSELYHLCRKLISLKIHHSHTNEEETISNLISCAPLLEFLYLCFPHYLNPPVIPHSWTQMTELHIVGYIADTGTNKCHLCDIAFHCEKLRKVALGPEPVFIKLNLFLHNLAAKCKDLIHLSIKQCKDLDKLAEYAYKDGLGKLLSGCPKLKYLELVSPNIGGYPSMIFNPPQNLRQNLPLEELTFGRVNNRFWKPPLETVGKMVNLKRLTISNSKSGFVPIEFLDTLSQTCSTITHLTIKEPCQGLLSNIVSPILDHIYLYLLKKLCLERYFTFITDDILRFIKRCSYLEELELTPVDDGIVDNIKTELKERPHRIIKRGVNMKLLMLSEIRWKQLTAPQWKDTWKSKV